MKRLLSVVAAVTVSAAAVVATSATPAFAAIQCTGFMSGNIPSSVVVPSGATCTLEEANVAGAIHVRSGGTLEILGSQLSRSNITANKPAGLYIDRSFIGGNVIVHGLTLSEEEFSSGICGSTIAGHLIFVGSSPETTFTVGTNEFGGAAQPAFEDGEGGCFAPNNIHGDVILTRNQGFFEVLGNQVGANMTAARNTGGGEISGNTIHGSLTCADNEPPLFTSNNSVTGNDSCGDFNP